jgi:hypothetical protein
MITKFNTSATSGGEKEHHPGGDAAPLPQGRVSLGGFEEALMARFGREAGGLSASTTRGNARGCVQAKHGERAGGCQGGFSRRV